MRRRNMVSFVTPYYEDSVDEILLEALINNSKQLLKEWGQENGVTIKSFTVENDLLFIEDGLDSLPITRVSLDGEDAISQSE